MKTLIIDFRFTDPELRLKGLTLKSLNGSNIWQRIYIDPDDKKIRIDSTFQINDRTAKIDQSFLIEILRELRSLIHFDRIKIKHHYRLSGEQILSEIEKATE